VEVVAEAIHAVLEPPYFAPFTSSSWGFQWKDGARNVQGGRDGGQRLARNTLLESRGKTRFKPHLKTCRICKSKLSQEGEYCNQCAFSKGICSMCGVKIADLTFDKRGLEGPGGKGRGPRRVEDEEEEGKSTEKEGSVQLAEGDTGVDGKRKATADGKEKKKRKKKAGADSGGGTAAAAPAQELDAAAQALEAISQRTAVASLATVVDKRFTSGAAVAAAAVLSQQPVLSVSLAASDSQVPAPSKTNGAAAENKVWQSATDAGSGKTYYYNTMTGVTQWDMPEELKLAPSSAQGDWLTATDAGSGKSYLYHRVTGETKWAE